MLIMLLRNQVPVCEHYPMGMMKNYLLNVLQHCSEEQFGQDAIEWAILSGMVTLSYDLDLDVHAIMSRYDQIIEAYRQSPAQAINRRAKAPMERATPRKRAARVASSARKKHAA